MRKKKDDDWFHCPQCGKDWKYWADGKQWMSRDILEVEDHTEMRFCPDHIEEGLKEAADIILNSPSVELKP